MHVIVASDEGFAGHLSALMHSLSTHSPGARLWVLDCGISEATAARLAAFGRERLAGLERIPVNQEVFAGIDCRSWGSASLARLLMPALLPAEVERAIYLDADTLALAPLEALWHLPLGGCLFAGAPDVWAFAHDVVETSFYVNTGVLLADLARWRHEGIGEAALTFLRSHPANFIDQSALNAVAAGRIQPLAPEWNYMIGLASWNLISLPPRQLPKILHFAGCDPRPWAYRDAPYLEIYAHHRQRGPLPLGRLPLRRGHARRWLGLLRQKPHYLRDALYRAEGRNMARRYFSTLPAETR